MATKRRRNKLTRDWFMAVRRGEDTFLLCRECGQDETPIGLLGSVWGVDELDQQIDLHIWAHATPERTAVPVSEFGKEHRAELARLFEAAKAR